MLKNSSKILFLLILMTGTMISISANSWLSAWMGLEINLLAFIPLMSNNKLLSTEASLKYFLTQALASSILLFTVILFLINFSSKYNSTMEMMISSSLLLKMGAAPFHFWFPNVMEGLSWINSLILMTWQKIAPIMLISYMMFKPLMMVTIIFSSIIGALGGINQTSLRKLMAYSSINHLSWMLSAIFYSNILWMTYFLFYSLLSFSMIYLFMMFEISHINQLFSLFFFSKNLKFITFFNLLSLGGLPPFIGFFPKWLIIQSLTEMNQIILLTIMLMMTLITLFFYMRLSFSSFMMNYYENNWMKMTMYNSNKMWFFMKISFISTFGLFLMIPLYFYF